MFQAPGNADARREIIIVRSTSLSPNLPVLHERMFGQRTRRPA
jgi:hypothetical protein